MDDFIVVCRNKVCNKVIVRRPDSSGYCFKCWWVEYRANPDRFPRAKFGLARGLNGFNNRKVPLVAKFVGSLKCNYPAVGVPKCVLGACGQ